MNSLQRHVSCLPVSLFQDFFQGSMTLKRWSAFAKGIGLDYIDINRKCLMDLTVGEVEKMAKDLYLPVMMVTTYSDFTIPDAEERTATIEAAKNDILITAALGGKYIRLTAGQHYPMQDEKEAIGYVYDGFEACVSTAEKSGVRILLENHSKPGAWQYNDFDFHFERMIKLWERVKELPIGINYDTANSYALHKWRELLEVFNGRIETIHVNDLDSIYPLRFTCIGDGIVPLEEQIRELFALGFQGPVCIEEAGMEGIVGIHRSVKFTKRLLEQIAQKS